MAFSQYTGGSADGYVSKLSIDCPAMTVAIENISQTTVICDGEFVNLQAQSNLPATYQWYFNGNLVTGGTNADMWASLAGDYYVDIIGDCETMQTSTITLTNAQTIDAGQISNNQTVCPNEDPAPFISDIAGTGEGTITYQWQYSLDEITWYDIAGETNEVYDAPVLGGTPPYTAYARRLNFDNCTTDTSNTVHINVEVCTNINELSDNYFEIYPNPANTYLQVKSENLKGKNIEVLDITGKVIKQVKSNKLDISDLQNGVYFIKIGTQVQKFIKE